METTFEQALPMKGHINMSNNERVATGIGALILALYGLKKRSLLGAGLALLGGFLLARSLKGYCPVYDLLGVNRGTDPDLLPPDEPPPPSVESGDEVDESSWESFPTSDPPSWTMGRRDKEE